MSCYPNGRGARGRMEGERSWFPEILFSQFRGKTLAETIEKLRPHNLFCDACVAPAKPLPPRSCPSYGLQEKRPGPWLRDNMKAIADLAILQGRRRRMKKSKNATRSF